MPPLCAGDQVIEVNVSTDPKKTRDITGEESQVVDFTYSAKWEETQIPFDRRMQKYSKYSFLPQHLEVRAHTACATLCFSAHLLFWRLGWLLWAGAAGFASHVVRSAPCRSTGSASSTAA